MKCEHGIVTKGSCNIKATTKQIEDHIENEEAYLPKNCSVNKCIAQGPYGQVKYRRFKSTWPVDDRDMVIVKAKRTDDKRVVMATRSIDY